MRRSAGSGRGAACALTEVTMRVARPTGRLAEVVRFYTRGLGMRVLDRFEGHDGFDGVMLGCPRAPWHLEITHKRGQRVGRAPTEDHLLVFYVADRARWRRALRRMRSAGYPRVASFNPYWERRGRTFADPDGYRVVLQNGRPDHG